ncbi:palmitoyl-protein thioesterase ABHD10, mitochondrial-like [Eriocheir sinensis]|uniref:palmitoyl-protein thioesterase ABHD10, mitochondrial-like n=1 Tax=Eriocheir sinensis TaxID=95602 RepID=UPI0021C5917C|nr:palmitoyl-protein thioesterase ABHD10, mitochondrial-like [Eriocheir sinensis]XP_050740349.1 palmitoyl-protein thioesterase ABHD10, mitochondrial-like [Eriocheir sinensis]XP_050740350.1 palmitoyl-protein thioesterase ABHD10, mitochondrial-like [Eriocheir sinensis]
MRLLGSAVSASRKVQSSLSSALPRALVTGFHMSASEPEMQFHEIKDRESGKTRRLAYQKLSGHRTHGLIFIPGFMSHKGGRKASGLLSFCQKHGFPYLRYDPSGLGESQGVSMTDTRFSLWLEDANEMLLKVADSPQIVVCSSMGCWLTSHLLQMHPEKVAGILMLAPGVNFHVRYEKALQSKLPPELLKKYEEGGVVPLFTDHGEFPLSKAFFGDMEKFTLNMEPNKLPVSVPVRIIHGMKDKDVDYTESLPLLNTLGTEDVQLTYLKHAGHRLSDEQSLEVIYDAILRLASEVDKKARLCGRGGDGGTVDPTV